MGKVFKELGDYEKALFHYQKALEIKIKSLGGAHGPTRKTTLQPFWNSKEKLMKPSNCIKRR